MTELPDAPWIREAEQFGPEEAEDIAYSCPVCGAEEPEDFLFDQFDQVIGCNCCCHFGDAYAWAAQQRADEQA